MALLGGHQAKGDENLSGMVRVRDNHEGAHYFIPGGAGQL